MNSYRDGMRAKKRKLLREDGYFFENRKNRWLRQFNASDDVSEFLTYQNVCASFEIEHAVRGTWSGSPSWSRLPTTTKSKRRRAGTTLVF